MANELAGAQVGAAPTQAPAAPAGAALPSPFSDVVAGTVPAISLAPIEGKKTDPAQEFVVSNFDALSAAGLDYHELENNESVFFNPSKITAVQIDEAFKAGKLYDLAPLVCDLGLPAASGAPSEASPAQPTAQAAPQPLNGASAGPDRALEGARLRNSAPAPRNTPNPVPGQLARRAI